MKRVTRFTLSLLLSLTFLSAAAQTAAAGTRRAKAARCVGATSCRACKNCRYCKHCAEEGGKCGVCRRRKSAEFWKSAAARAPQTF